MTTGDGVSLAEIGVTLVILALGFAYRSVKERIDKMEEVSRLEDEQIVSSIEKLTELVRVIDDKYRDNDRELYQSVSVLKVEIARLQEILKCRNP